MIEASQQFERYGDSDCDNENMDIEASERYSSSQFGKAATTKMVEEVRKPGVPIKMQQSTSWVHNVWAEWAQERKQRIIEDIEKGHQLCETFADMCIDNMVFWLPKFVLEVRNRKGELYPLDSLYNLCCGLQRSIHTSDREDAINIFDGPFQKFRQVLDSLCKSTRKEVPI